MTEHAILRTTAIDCYNRGFQLVIEGDASTALEGLELAATSLHLWKLVGTPTNEAIGLWLYSRALEKTGARDAAREAANLSIAIAKKLEIDWMIASGTEALTRASRETAEFDRLRAETAALIDAIVDTEERELISGQFADLR